MIRIVLTAGERPEPLTYQFLAADGVPMDMTGFDAVEARVVRPPAAAVLAVAATWHDQLTGVAKVTWPVPCDALEAAGVATAQVWATNTTTGQRLASVPIRYRIEPVTTPTP